VDTQAPDNNDDVRIPAWLMDRLIGMRIPGEARQVLDVVIRKTCGSGKDSEWITTGEFMDLTGLSKEAVSRARKRLQDMNLITVMRKRKGQVLIYSIQQGGDK
jgi:phage replication O-like protein O